MSTTVQDTNFTKFEDFWPFYLSQHQDSTCRRLHIVGTTLALLLAFYSLVLARRKKPLNILLGLVIAYSFAWVGHFFFEQNTPATFKYPMFSLLGDLRMVWMFYSRQSPW